MNTQLLTFALLLTATSAFAQQRAPTEAELYVGERVTIVAPHYRDDGRVGKIIGFNEATVNVEYSQIKLDNTNQPVALTATQLWSTTQIRPTLATDTPFHVGQLVRVNAPGFAEHGMIGTAKAIDGTHVIFEGATSPTEKKLSLWSNDRIVPASRFDFQVYPDDIIRVYAPGFAYSGLNLKVMFNNGSKLWISYTDNHGKECVTVLPALNYKILQRAFRLDFEIDDMAPSLQTLAGVVYGARQTFFNVLATHVDEEIPLSGNALTAGNALSARVFLYVAMAPVIQDSDSEVFVHQVVPIYQAMRNRLPVQKLPDIEQSLQVSKSACLIMRASLEAMLQSVGNPADKAALTALHTQVGLLSAGRLTRNEMMSFLSAAQTQDSMLARLSGDVQTKEMAITFVQVVEYMKAKN